MKIALLVPILFSCFILVKAQVYSPIPVSGFNEDVVAEGSGNSSLSTTTKEMDAVPISNFVLCTREFADANSFTPSGLYGLPDNGLLTTTTADRSFQFASFDGNNALYLFPTETGALTLNTPARYTNISLLTLSTEGSSTVSVSFDFTDGTHQVETKTISDWFDNIMSPFNSYGRLKRKDGPFTASTDYAGAENGKPVLAMLDFTLPCTKTLNSITIKNTSSGSTSSSFRSFIFAVSGLEIILKPTITTSATDTTICAGTVVTFTATSTNGGSAPEYLWKVNSAFVGTNTTFSSSTLQNNDLVTCILTSNLACAAPPVVTSTPIKIHVNPLLSPSDTITATDTAICEGTAITFTATPTNGGSNPVYQWLLNNIPVGENSTTYASDSLKNGDKVRCVMTSSAICLTKLSDISNRIAIEVTPVYTLIINPIDTLNANEPAVQLVGEPSGGIFSGHGVVGTTFNPAIAGVGTHPIRYILPDNQCTESVSSDIVVKQLPCDLTPETLFSPNGDGKNDLWEIGIFNSACILKAKVEVYNRWGKRVYRSDNYANNWNGTDGGKALSEGTYFFKIDYTIVDNPGSFSKTGTLTLFR